MKSIIVKKAYKYAAIFLIGSILSSILYVYVSYESNKSTTINDNLNILLKRFLDINNNSLETMTLITEDLRVYPYMSAEHWFGLK